MPKVNIGELSIDPVKNPAVLDTASWNIPKAVSSLQTLDRADWALVEKALREGCLSAELDVRGIRFQVGSRMSLRGEDHVLALLPDSQFVFVRLGGSRGISEFGHLYEIGPGDSRAIFAISAEYETIHRMIRALNPLKGPRALGGVPRLGIGSRNSWAAWPAVYSSMKRERMVANAIQNSMREIGPLEEVSSRKPVAKSYLFGFGEVPPAYTGGTFEGIWTYGVLQALCADHSPIYGADADHLQLKSDSESFERLKRILRSARHYSFYTMDVSHIVDYQAMFTTSCSGAEALAEQKIPDVAIRNDVMAFHKQRFWFNGRYFRFDDALLSRLLGKYWTAFDRLDESYQFIRDFKLGEPFDFELTVDEVPPGINPHEIKTSEEELLFLLNEATRRGIAISHIAPNFGVEKTTDYRGADGLDGLRSGVENLHAIAERYGVMLDCHSGDDLSYETRSVFGKATGGRIHFKISPSIGDVFAETLFDYDRERFMVWWNDTLEFAKACAKQGSVLAAGLLKERSAKGEHGVDPKDFLFKEFKFSMAGKKDASGQLSAREYFYDLPEGLRLEYSSRLENWISQVAKSVFAG